MHPFLVQIIPLTAHTNPLLFILWHYFLIMSVQESFTFFILCALLLFSKSSYYLHPQMFIFHSKCWAVVNWFPEQLDASNTLCEGRVPGLAYNTRMTFMSLVGSAITFHNLSKGVKIHLYSNLMCEENTDF